MILLQLYVKNFGIQSEFKMLHSTYQLLLLKSMLIISSVFLFHSAFPILRINLTADALMSESKEYMSGKVIRIVMIHVSN